MTTIYCSVIHLAERFGVCRGTIWKWTREKKFPKPVKISKGCTRWILDEVIKWESSLHLNMK